MTYSFQQGKQESFCNTEMAEAHRSEIISWKTHSFLKTSTNTTQARMRAALQCILTSPLKTGT